MKTVFSKSRQTMVAAWVDSYFRVCTDATDGAGTSLSKR